MEVFKEFFTTKDKIFGYGPETFRVLMENYYLGELGNVIFDNAHNEYLHYLITIGLFGMLSYMAWWAPPFLDGKESQGPAGGGGLLFAWRLMRSRPR